MYYDYFGFNQPPFKITPDTNLFYSGGDRGAILDALLYAILNGEGIVKVVGEVGSGKTMLCRMLEKELPDNVEVVYLVNPSIAPENTLHAIAFELKLAVNSGTSRFEVMNQLQKYLLQRHSDNRQVVVFVEEAQSMPIATLEEIRLLSNLETQQSKLLQIVLFGQPELDEMIARPEIRQLKERITYSFQLTPFKTNDIREYINTRVRACGYRAGELFDDAALKQIEHYSKGLLRRINILADKSLLAAFAENNHKVSGKHARLAARDSEFVAATPWYKQTVALAAGITLIIVGLLAGYLVYFTPSRLISPEADVLFSPGEDPPAQTNQPPDTIDMAEVPEVLSGSGSGNAGEHVSSAAVPTENTSTDEQIRLDPAETMTLSPDQGVLVATNAVDTSVVPDSAAVVIEIQSPDSLDTLAPEVDPHPSAKLQDQIVSEQQPTENQLLGLSAIYKLIDFTDSRLTDTETQQLQRQLMKLPPESAEHLSLDDDNCETCWSIIYRPVWATEKL